MNQQDAQIPTYELYSQTLVCGTTVRTTAYQSAHTACKQTLKKMDRWGPKHVELTKSAE